MSFDNDAYGRTVSMTTDGTTDTYLIGGAIGIMFPAQTPQPQVYLAFARQCNLARFQASLNDYLDSKYSQAIRLNLIGLYLNAVAENLANRTAYLLQILIWQNAVMSYAGAYTAALSNMTDIPTIVSTLWDPRQIAVADPQISALAAVQIPN